MANEDLLFKLPCELTAFHMIQQKIKQRARLVKLRIEIGQITYSTVCVGNVGTLNAHWMHTEYTCPVHWMHIEYCPLDMSCPPNAHYTVLWTCPVHWLHTEYCPSLSLTILLGRCYSHHSSSTHLAGTEQDRFQWIPPGISLQGLVVHHFQVFHRTWYGSRSQVYYVLT